VLFIPGKEAYQALTYDYQLGDSIFLFPASHTFGE
jgi:hypothetical protein